MIKKIELVLVIDDSEDNQILLSMLLKSKGYQVYTASNGREALALLSELSTLPDLILLDAQMPIMNGYQFRAEQKMNSRLKNIPVIVMTADDNLKTLDKMLDPHLVLIKPLDCNRIISEIAAVHL
jgi:CheY-like chemotaxis protein